MADVGILGADAVRGDPEALNAVAGFLRTVAQQLHDVRTTLGQRTFNDIWEGAAADAFGHLLGETPPDLAKAESSYDAASQAVGTYVARLRDARSMAQNLANELAALQQQGSRLEGSVRNAGQTVANARTSLSHATDPSAHAIAQHRLDAALRTLADLQGQQRSLQGQMDSIRRRANDNRRALDAAAQIAGDELVRASHLGIRNSLGSWLHRNTHWLGSVEHATVSVLHAAVKPIEDACDLFRAIGALVRDPSFKALDETLNDLSDALTVVAVAALAVAGAAAIAAVLVGSGGTALPVLAAGAMEIFADAKLAGAGVDSFKLGVDLGQTVSGRSSVSLIDLGADFAAFGLDVAGLKEPVKIRQSNWFQAIRRDSTSVGWKRWAAQCQVFGEGKPLSWSELDNVHRVRSQAVKMGKEYGQAAILDQAQDLDHKLEPRLDSEVTGWLRSRFTRIEHTFSVPVPAMPAAA